VVAKRKKEKISKDNNMANRKKEKIMIDKAIHKKLKKNKQKKHTKS
jgi:hypothetical protein